MARQRDYRAERERRNALARERGYTSLDAQARARRKGNAASSDRAAPSYTLPSGVTSLSDLNNRANAWSRQHSRQPATRFNPRWSVARRIAFYDAFVAKHTGFNIDRYIDEYPTGFEPDIVDEVRAHGHYYGKR